MPLNKTLLIFYILVIYVLAELLWWGILLIRAEPHRIGMILGEAFVFVSILFIGAYHVHKTINQECILYQQQKSFLLSVTHELKSPLAAIKLYLQTIQKRTLQEHQQNNFISKCLIDIERLDDLVENMLLAASIDKQSYSLLKEKFNFSALVEEVVSRLRLSSYDATKQVIHADIDAGIELIGDRFALSSVVGNLIENAIKYADACEHVHVGLFSKGKTVCLTVSDRGIGIPDSEKKHIFDRFYRVEREDTRKAKGTGLGLYIVKQILDRHKATIQVMDNKPYGSVFKVVFFTI